MNHLPRRGDDVQSMLRTVGVECVDELFTDIPEDVRLDRELDLPPALSELDLVAHLKDLASRTDAHVVSFVGAGCSEHFIPAAVDALASRGEFTTSYTPYQPEASQGNLQAFFEYQTLIARLTGCEVSNASMYDGASATAEAALMARGITARETLAVDAGLHGEYRATLDTYLRHVGPETRTVEHAGGRVDPASLERALAGEPAALIVQSPDFFGVVHDWAALAKAAHAAGALLVAVVDPVSLGLLKSPGALGADIVVGEGQPLGIPRSFGGPGFGFFATRMEFVRHMPGRLVGEATDRRGRKGYVLTLQAREQHIRRERATSNICSNQALMALRAAIHLSLLGPRGLRRVAELCLAKAHYAAERLAQIPGVGLRFGDAPFFNEFALDVPIPASELRRRAIALGVDPGLDLGRIDPALDRTLLVAVTECRTKAEIDRLADVVRRACHGDALASREVHA